MKNYDKNKIIAVFLRLSVLIVKFSFFFVLAKLLPPEEVGAYGLVLVTVTFLVYFFGLEFYTFSSRDIVTKPKYNWSSYIYPGMIVFFIIYLFVSPAIYFLVELEIAEGLGEVVLVLILLEFVSSDLYRYLIVMNRQVVASFILFIKQALWPIVFCLIALVCVEARNLVFLFVIWSIGVSISILVATFYFYKKFSLSFDFEGKLVWVKRGLFVCFPLFISSFSTKFLFVADRYAFENLNGMELLAAYSLYMGAGSALLSFLESSLFLFVYPKIIKAYKEQMFDYFNNEAKIFLKKAIVMSSVGGGVICLLGYIVFPYFDGVYYQNIQLYFLLVLSLYVFSLGCAVQMVLYSAQEDKVILISNFLGLIVSTVSFVSLMSFTSYWCVPVSLLIGFFASLGYKLLFLSKVLH